MAWVLLGLVRLYRLVPKTRDHCRYHPTCSAYAVEALQVHGAVRGSWLTLRRLGRCHPWGGTGLDPVPPRRNRGRPPDDHHEHPHPAAETGHRPRSTTTWDS